LVTPREIAEEIGNNVNLTEVSGFDLTTFQIMKSLKRKA
jgi:hypothetical protein